jgi:hypothetical protein
VILVLALAGGAELLGIGLAFFADWGGPRRLARRLRPRPSTEAPVTRTLIDDLAGRVKELA